LVVLDGHDGLGKAADVLLAGSVVALVVLLNVVHGVVVDDAVTTTEGALVRGLADALPQSLSLLLQGLQPLRGLRTLVVLRDRRHLLVYEVQLVSSLLIEVKGDGILGVRPALDRVNDVELLGRQDLIDLLDGFLHGVVVHSFLQFQTSQRYPLPYGKPPRHGVLVSCAGRLACVITDWRQQPPRYPAQSQPGGSR